MLPPSIRTVDGADQRPFGRRATNTPLPYSPPTTKPARFKSGTMIIPFALLRRVSGIPLSLADWISVNTVAASRMRSTGWFFGDDSFGAAIVNPDAAKRIDTVTLDIHASTPLLAALFPWLQTVHSSGQNRGDTRTRLTRF